MRIAALVLSSISLIGSSINLIVFIINKKPKRKANTKAYKRCKWNALSAEEKDLLNCD